MTNKCATPTIRFRVKDLRLYQPMNDEVTLDGPNIGSVICPRCRNHIDFVAEVSAIEVKRTVKRHCDHILEAAILLVGQADEFFEETSGESYRRSIQRQGLLRLERLAKRFRDEFQGGEVNDEPTS